MSEGLIRQVADALGGDVLEQVDFRGESTVVISAPRIREALREARTAGFTFLTDLTAVDRSPAEPRFEVVYLLTAPEAPARLRLKVRLSADQPVVASATAEWPAANWMEREVFDLFGIRFDGHPDLRRILLPDDWEGHPLRKDFPLVEEPVQFIGHTPNVPSRIIPKTPPRQP
ncbi:MAG TPA: NADH-quinone oxidoreductase subunit C [bacterium]|jgi:NADH-quinone oxidoreductase subunit C